MPTSWLEVLYFREWPRGGKLRRGENIPENPSPKTVWTPPPPYDTPSPPFVHAPVMVLTWFWKAHSIARSPRTKSHDTLSLQLLPPPPICRFPNIILSICATRLPPIYIQIWFCHLYHNALAKLLGSGVFLMPPSGLEKSLCGGSTSAEQKWSFKRGQCRRGRSEIPLLFGKWQLSAPVQRKKGGKVTKAKKIKRWETKKNQKSKEQRKGEKMPPKPSTITLLRTFQRTNVE